MSRSTAAFLLALSPLLAAGPGCRSFQGNFLRRELAQAPASAPERPDPEELVRTVALEHDRRAGVVRALKVSDLSIKIDTFQDDSGRERSPLVGGTAGGVLVMERPRNLKVDLRKPGMAVADIGSNDREFWFANDMAHEMIVGQYAQTQEFADPMLASVRPDWIFEVLGLEPIPDDVEIREDESGTTLTLVERRSFGNGGTMVKESVLNVVEQRIVEHRLSTEKGELIARARVEQPQRVAVGPADGAEPPATVELPRIVRLTIPQVAELTMELGRVTLNPTDDFAAMTTFERPEKRGYQVVDIMTLAGAPGVALASGGPSTSASASASPSPAPAPEAVTPPASSREASPGALNLPRSDRSVARTEDVSVRPESQARSVLDEPVALDLPTPSGAPAAEIRRRTWEPVDGNRFRRGVLGRE